MGDNTSGPSFVHWQISKVARRSAIALFCSSIYFCSKLMALKILRTRLMAPRSLVAEAALRSPIASLAVAEAKAPPVSAAWLISIRMRQELATLEASHVRQPLSGQALLHCLKSCRWQVASADRNTFRDSNKAACRHILHQPVQRNIFAVVAVVHAAMESLLVSCRCYKPW